MERKTSSETWTLSIGAIPGYELEGKQPMDIQTASEVFRSCAERVFCDTGVYVSAVIADCRMLYRSEWGCPQGGECGFLFRGTRNPLFTEQEPYHDALLKLVRELKKELKQSAVYLETQPTTLIYFTEESDHEQ